nr:UPF0175 family protein [Robertmurraya andreesenii]
MCKDCKKSGFDILDFEEDEFDFEEWDDWSFNPYEDRVSISLPDEFADQLRVIAGEKSLEAAVNASITITLFLSNKISLEKAAYLTDRPYNDFIELLERNGFSWDVGSNDGNKEYRNSIPALLKFIDEIVDD